MTAELYCGDCLDILPTLAADSVDTCITDPPYGLEFMGKDWDHGIPGVRYWREVYHVLKPGAMLLAFGGTRTFHRLTCAIEDAGFEIRDCIMWVYGNGFPKSHDISKAIDKAAGVEREMVGVRKGGTSNVNGTPGAYNFRGRDIENGSNNMTPEFPITAPATPSAALWDGWGTALKPAWEPIIVAMKPRDGTFAHNALTWGVAGINVDGARVGTSDGLRGGRYADLPDLPDGNAYGTGINKRSAHEFVQPQGRWPANLIHDGSAEVVGLFPETKSGGGPKPGTPRSKVNTYGEPTVSQSVAYGCNEGSAARFFYAAKASRSERNAGCDGMGEGGGEYRPNDPDENTIRTRLHGRKQPGNHHPTVKPLALMRYLCRLTATPTGGVVLDPFAGSGSTGCGAVLEGRDFIGIDLSAEYVEIARRRIEHWQGERIETPRQMTMEVE